MRTKVGITYDKTRGSTINLRSADRKIVLVGDSCVGKSSMFYNYTRGSHPHVYVPTLVESEQVEVTPEGNDDYPLDVTVWDTAGQEDYDRLRPMSYSHTDAFIVCFSVNDTKSFKNVTSRWIPELRHFCPDAPLILVATKTEESYSEDYQISPDESPITRKQGRQLAKRIHACAYMECCVNNPEDVRKIFQAAVLVTLVPFGQHVTKSGKRMYTSVDRKLADKLSAKVNLVEKLHDPSQI